MLTPHPRPHWDSAREAMWLQSASSVLPTRRDSAWDKRICRPVGRPVKGFENSPAQLQVENLPETDEHSIKCCKMGNTISARSECHDLHKEALLASGKSSSSRIRDLIYWAK